MLPTRVLRHVGCDFDCYAIQCVKIEESEVTGVRREVVDDTAAGVGVPETGGDPGSL